MYNIQQEMNIIINFNKHRIISKKYCKFLILGKKSKIPTPII